MLSAPPVTGKIIVLGPSFSSPNETYA